MPPNPPTGWQIPVWLQIVFILGFVLSPPLSITLNYWLKDRRAAKASEGQALVGGQQSFMDKLLKAAEMVPDLMEKNEALMNENAQSRADVRSLQEQIKELQVKVSNLERDRDHWREMALKIPSLEGQVQTYQTLLREKESEINALRMERDEARFALSSIVNTH